MKPFSLTLDKIANIINFVVEQEDKSKDKIAAALKDELGVDEDELESLIRLHFFVESRGIDENNNGQDILQIGWRVKVLAVLGKSKYSIDRIKTVESLTKIGY